MSIDLATFITMDIEASSFNSDESYPVSIGLAGPGTQNWYRIVSPMEGWVDWDEVAEILHGIERDTAISHGREPFLVARELNAMLTGQTVVVDSPWDIHWISKLYDDVGVRMSFTVALLENIVSGTAGKAIREKIESQDWPHVANEDAGLLRKIIVSCCTSQAMSDGENKLAV